MKMSKINNKNEANLKKEIKCKEDVLLGTGAFGTVKRGFCTNNRIMIAVKRTYVDTITKSEEEIKAIKEEVELLKTLSHPNIISYYGSRIEKDILKIYMEYADNGSLSKMLQMYGKLEETVASRFTRQILKGLEYIHSRGIIHRDIKGGNILVSREGIVKLADFGCAKRLQTYADSMKGTTCWMAPEVR